MTTTTAPSHRARVRARWPERARRIEVYGAGFVLAVVAVVGFGWLAGVDALLRPAEGMQTMKFNSVLIFGLIAGSHLARGTTVRRGLLAAALGLSVLLLIQYPLGVSLGLDQLVVTDNVAPLPDNPGRPSETTLLCSAVIAVGGLLSSMGWRKVPEYLHCVPLVAGTLALWGYVYGVPGLYRIGPYSSMALHTALTIAALALLGLLVVSRGTLQWIIFGRDPGAVLQRILIPLAFIVLPTGGWLRVKGEEQGYYDPSFGTALMVTFMALVVITVGLIAGRTAVRIDAERDELVEELHRVNQELEDRVRSRSLQLNRQRTKLALLEERDRIARDLHDRVIQRIFAAGLQVGSTGRVARKLVGPDGEPDTRVVETLNSVATELDMAIRELRNSIFELTSIADHDDIEQVVRDVSTRASRILGFTPSITVQGVVVGLDADIVANVASVLQEALSNIARHARASSAEVIFFADDDIIEVRVADDGIGMPDPLPRSSGVTNISNRATTLGGEAVWAPLAEGGTVMTWRIPRDLARQIAEDQIDGSTLNGHQPAVHDESVSAASAPQD